jgi:hypothetical protein
MRHSIIRLFAGLILILSVSFSAFATPITYIYTGLNSSGSLGGISFSNADFTITALADTDNIGPWCCSYGGRVMHSSATLKIDGFSIVDIITNNHSWYASGVFGLGGGYHELNWMTFRVPTGGYDLTTSIEFSSSVDGFPEGEVMTTAGEVLFTGAGNYERGSFQAIVSSVPEPSTLAIFALGMIGLASRRFKKQS